MTSSDISDNQLELQLGDIIEINAPDNPDINGFTFFIEYIDNTEIKILNIEDKKSYILKINDGKLEDSSIEQISLIDRASSSSFAQQNNLFPGTWIKISFLSEQDSFDIIGLIINLDEDLIQVKTYPENDEIYIDFAYKGLPKDLPIETITIIPNPTIPDTKEIQEIDESDTVPVGFESISPQDTASSKGDIIDPEYDISQQLINQLGEADEIELGDDLEEIEILEDVPDFQKRFSIDKQVEDLLSELLSKLPIKDRTDSEMNRIHNIIARFIQLRNNFSKFDINGNANIIPEIENVKPLIDILINQSKNVDYFKTIAVNRLKLYNRNPLLISDSDNVDLIDEYSILTREVELEDEFKKGSTQIDESKYITYYKIINGIYTPFTNPLNENDIIASINVENNVEAILNNVGNFESIVAKQEKKNEGLTENVKFYLQPYNLGLIYSSKEGKVKISNNDNIFIQGFLFLKKKFLFNFLKRQPKSNILVKLYLNNTPIYQFNNLNEDFIPNVYTIDNFINPDERSEYYKNNFLNMSTFYQCDDDLIAQREYNLFSKFLDKIIPTNEQFFNQYNKYLDNKFSKSAIIDSLQIFNIFPDNVNFKLSEIINDKLNKNIVSYIDFLAKKTKEFKSSSQYKLFQYTNYWLKLLEVHKSLYTIILDAYGLDNDLSITNSELLSRIFKIDNGLLFILSIIRINIDLNAQGLIEEFVAQYESQLSDETYGDNNCKIISNKYYTLEDLEGTNDSIIYFDKEFDKTDYKFLEKYKKQQDVQTPEQFKDYLVNEFKRKKKLTFEESIKEVDSIIEGKRLVKNGDYAILDLGDGNFEYYMREGNKWIKDTNLSNNVEIKDNKLFCNLQDNCISINNRCENLNNAKQKTEDEILDKIYDDFEENYTEKDSELREIIDLKLENSIKYVKLLKNWEKADFYKYDRFKLLLTSLSYEQVVIEQSPYLNIRELVLSIPDFVKRQNYIQKFVVLFTRPPNYDENQYWLYCKKTNTKLLPIFLSHLANVFISGGDYIFELDLVADKQGAISDDGNAYVDKYSGYFIKNIDFNTEEGFTEEGFRLKTRDKLEKDLGDAVLELVEPNDKLKSLTKEEQTVINIIKTITGANGMMINIENDYDFIVTNVIRLYSKIIPSIESYQDLVKKLEKQGKNAPAYQELLDTPLLQLTLIYILITIQVSIPSISSRKTFPGCIKSFEGYPVYDDSKEAITYLACVAIKMKSSIPPWYTLGKIKIPKLVEKLEKTIDKFKILDNQYVRQKINEKKLYLKTNKSDQLIVDNEIYKNLSQFLPPLVDIKISPLPLSSGFVSTLKSSIKKGNKDQENMLQSIKSKGFEFGLLIQSKINVIVKQNSPLISSKSGELFLQNACCDTISPNVFDYFTGLDSSIVQDNEIVKNVSSLLQEIKDLSVSPLLYDPYDSRVKWPQVGKIFTRDTIYRAFIVYCRNQKLLLSKEIREVCSLGELSPFIEDSTEEIIEILKEKGINYDESLLEQLIQLVNLKNIIKIDLRIRHSNKLQKLETLLQKLQDQSNGIDSQFISKFYMVIDTFDIRHKEYNPITRELKNYLSLKNNEMSEKLKIFIKSNTSLSKSKFLAFIECIDNLTEFKSSENSNSSYNQKESIFTMINFFKEISRNIVNVFPFIVKNNVNFSDVRIPSHWGLSQRHNKDIQEIISNYYKNLKQYFDNEDLKNILRIIPEKCLIFKEFIEYTPYFNERDSEISVFDERLIKLLFNYYILNILNIHIDLTQIEISQIKPITSVGETLPESSIQLEDKEVSEKQKELLLVSQLGTLKEIEKSMSDYLVTIIDIICKDKEFINFTNEDIHKKILSAKEREKDGITEYLQALTDDERNVEKLFKKHKLEKWGKGLQKGLTQYVADNYDEERQALEDQEIKDRALSQVKGINEGNRNIYQYELEESTKLDQEIEKEEFSLVDYGGDDGPQEYDEFDYED